MNPDDIDTRPIRKPVEPRPIERYVRAQVEIPGSKGRIDGAVEIGLMYEFGEALENVRDTMTALAGAAIYAANIGRGFDVDFADYLTTVLDEHLVCNFGDRPRFIEVWRDDEPLTQWYAPHRVPACR